MPDSYAPVLTVDLGAIVANYRLLAGRVSPGLCGAAIKADGYGLGAAMIAPHLRRAGCDHFFVTVASFCMGKRETYEYIHDNPSMEFRTIDYTNSPLIIARHSNMTAINSALEIDLTGQATAESIGKFFYSGIGGQADFMRGTILAPGGRTILALQSTAQKETISRIVPFLK